MATTSNQKTETKMTRIRKICNLRFVKLCTVFNNDSISNQSVKNKNDHSHRGLVKLCEAVATDSGVSNQAAEWPCT